MPQSRTLSQPLLATMFVVSISFLTFAASFAEVPAIEQATVNTQR